MSAHNITPHEARLIERLRERRRGPFITRTDWVKSLVPSFDLSTFQQPGDLQRRQRLPLTVDIDLRSLERRGLIERWPAGVERWRWTATDRAPSFEWPHWTCQIHPFDGRMVTITADVGAHPRLHYPIRLSFDLNAEFNEPGVIDYMTRRIVLGLNDMRHELKRARRLRASGESCECGGCEPPITPQAPAHAPETKVPPPIETPAQPQTEESSCSKS